MHIYVTGETRPITNHIDCNSKKRHLHDTMQPLLQTIHRWTKRRLKDRFNEDRRPVDDPSNISKPTTVSKHFRTNDHSANDITFIPLELIKSDRDSAEKPEKHTSSREVKLLNH